MNLVDLLASLPEPWPEPLRAGTRERVLEASRTLFVLDDDPTGTQTVHDVPVLTKWDQDTLREVIAEEHPVVYLLTNSRACLPDEARRINVAIAGAAREAGRAMGREIAFVSRSDSTLRGHYPLETDALAKELGWETAPVLIAPFFEEGGRITVDDVHYVVEGETAVPAAETPFAQDAVFGFRHSNLRDWVEEKTGGKIAAKDVQSLSLRTIREGGVEAVSAQLGQLPAGSVCVLNAVEMRDMEVIAAAIYDVWDHGKQFLIRSAASIVRALAGLDKRPLLSRDDIVRAGSSDVGGLVVVGSHVPKSTRQLEMLLENHLCTPVELEVRELLNGDRHQIVSDLAGEVDRLLKNGDDVVVFTSRTLATGDSDAENLAISRQVSTALVEIVSGLSVDYRYLIAKGGITSSDIATAALHVVRANIAGQLQPGVPVWKLGDESAAPGLGYVVFPGNVGADNALVEAVRRLSA